MFVYSHPLSTLAYNLATVACRRRDDERVATRALEDLLSKIRQEWRELVRHPLFRVFSGEDTKSRRDAYLQRRLSETRAQLRGYTYRTEYRAFDRMLEAKIDELEGAN